MVGNINVSVCKTNVAVALRRGRSSRTIRQRTIKKDEIRLRVADDVTRSDSSVSKVGQEVAINIEKCEEIMNEIASNCDNLKREDKKVIFIFINIYIYIYIYICVCMHVFY